MEFVTSKRNLSLPARYPARGSPSQPSATIPIRRQCGHIVRESHLETRIFQWMVFDMNSRSLSADRDSFRTAQLLTRHPVPIGSHSAAAGSVLNYMESDFADFAVLPSVQALREIAFLNRDQAPCPYPRF